jgi:hypothetical protein
VERGNAEKDRAPYGRRTAQNGFAALSARVFALMQHGIGLRMAARSLQKNKAFQVGYIVWRKAFHVFHAVEFDEKQIAAELRVAHAVNGADLRMVSAEGFIVANDGEASAERNADAAFRHVDGAAAERLTESVQAMLKRLYGYGFILHVDEQPGDLPWLLQGLSEKVQRIKTLCHGGNLLQNVSGSFGLIYPLLIHVY